MGKVDELSKRLGAKTLESIGVGLSPWNTGGAGGASALSVPARLQGVNKARNANEIPVERIHRDPNQPREEFDEEALARLAESLRTRGQLQPIRVRWDEAQGVYLIVCGERRWRAARMAGLATVTAIVAEGEIPPAELLAMQLVENCLREDLRPVEQARAYRSLMDANGWSIRQLAGELALDHSGVAKTLALLELPGPVQQEVDRGGLPPAAGYELSKLDDPAAQEELGRRAVEEPCSTPPGSCGRPGPQRPRPTPPEVKMPRPRDSVGPGRGGRLLSAGSRLLRLEREGLLDDQVGEHAPRQALITVPERQAPRERPPPAAVPVPDDGGRDEVPVALRIDHRVLIGSVPRLQPRSRGGQPPAHTARHRWASVGPRPATARPRAGNHYGQLACVEQSLFDHFLSIHIADLPRRP
jgi:ParB family chromosome partitioning protein